MYVEMSIQIETYNLLFKSIFTLRSDFSYLVKKYCNIYQNPSRWVGPRPDGGMQRRLSSVPFSIFFIYLLLISCHVRSFHSFFFLTGLLCILNAHPCVCRARRPVSEGMCVLAVERPFCFPTSPGAMFFGLH